MIWPVVKGLILAAAFAYGAYRDIRTREIPDAVPIVILLAGFIGFSPLDSVLGLLAAGLPFLIAALTGGMGGGDLRLMAASGFALGLWGGILQTITGLALALLFAVIRKKARRHDALPLAPFLGAGGIFAYLTITIFTGGCL